MDTYIYATVSNNIVCCGRIYIAHLLKGYFWELLYTHAKINLVITTGFLAQMWQSQTTRLLQDVTCGDCLLIPNITQIFNILHLSVLIMNTGTFKFRSSVFPAPCKSWEHFAKLLVYCLTWRWNDSSQLSFDAIFYYHLNFFSRLYTYYLLIYFSFIKLF